MQDLLTDAPGECSILATAIAAGVPGMLRGHIDRGLDGRTAISLTSVALARRLGLEGQH